MSGQNRIYKSFGKRAMDITIGSCLLTLSLPVMAIIALAVLIDSGWPVLFIQERCGLKLKRFGKLAFRTMTNGRHKIINYPVDSRLTRIGKLIRPWHLDMLPELVNVVKGDMSLVGPRPMPWPVEDEAGIENIGQIGGCELRHSVRPGMTGLAQIRCTKFIKRRSKYRYDILYIRKMGFSFDVMLLFWTAIYAMLGGEK